MDTTYSTASRRESLVFAVKIAARLVLSPFFSLRVEGLDHLPAENGFILLPKHQRWADVPLVALACSRQLYFVAKQELFHPAAAGWFIRGLGGVPLNRSRPLESRASLRAVNGLLCCGAGVVVFPEGTYYPGHVGPGRPGMIRFVCSRNTVPLIPVGVRYRRGGMRTVVRITFGRPITPGAVEEIPLLLDRVMERISALSGLPRTRAL